LVSSKCLPESSSWCNHNIHFIKGTQSMLPVRHHRGKRMISLSARKPWTDSPALRPTMLEKLGKRSRRLSFDDGKEKMATVGTMQCARLPLGCRLLKM
jgi:hypothetical protein